MTLRKEKHQDFAPKLPFLHRFHVPSMALRAIPDLPPMFSFVRYRFSGALVLVQDLRVIRAHHVLALQRVLLAKSREQVPEPIRQITLSFIVHRIHLARTRQ